MDRDDRPVDLLNLLLLEGQGGNQRNIKAALNAHDVTLVPDELQAMLKIGTNKELPAGTQFGANR
jgi:hypothetical protein